MPNAIPTFRKTRLAPTPSGYLHLGNVLSFALTAALAKTTGAKILLRIDDLDRVRAEERYVRDIFDTLNFLEIPWDEGPRNYGDYENSWSQVHRMALYQDELEQLKANNKLFACTCSRSQIRSINADDTYPGTCIQEAISFDDAIVSWRLRTDPADLIFIKTLQGIIPATLPAVMANFVVRKKDGSPAYQLTSMLDDLHYGVDLVVRGADLWPSTVAQHSLALAMDKAGLGKITFYHHPLLMAEVGRKLSKSAGDTSVHYLREQGKTPADIYTAIARMLGSNEPASNWKALAEIFNSMAGI